MADPQQRFATITGTLADYLPVTNISGEGQTFTTHLLQVKLETVDIEPTAWEWPHFHFVYVALADLLDDVPVLGEHIQADGALSLTNFVLDGSDQQTASAVKTLYQRIVLSANNWSEANLVDQQRHLFDTLTREFAASPWRLDEWLNAQCAMLPENSALTTLQALLTSTALLRSRLLIKSAPLAALMQDLTAIKLSPQPSSMRQAQSRLQSSHHELRQRDDQARLVRQHLGLLAQSAALSHSQSRRQV